MDVLGALQGNPYFSAGAGLYGVGIGLMMARGGSRVAVDFIKRYYLTTIEMTNKDPSYSWLLDWMGQSQKVNFQQMSVQSSAVIRCNEKARGSFSLTPSPGRHFFFYHGRLIVVNRKRFTDRGTDILETMELTTVGRSRETMMALLDEAMVHSTNKEADKTVIYFNSGNQWTRFHNTRKKRPMESVILEGTKRERLVRDVKHFLSKGDEYNSLGIPYRRGYLLYGPPGCGKSSFIYALAGEVDMAICVLNLSNKYLTDDSLPQLLGSAPEPSIILVEDVDHAFTQHSRISLSGLLNAIDGVAAQEGRLLFMTTNHLERLEPALIRPGRVDVQEEFGHATPQQIEDMFCRFFPDHVGRCREFAEVFRGQQLSIAKLQGYFFIRRDSVEAAFNDIALLVGDSGMAAPDLQN
eukprot:EG_transcript_12438